MAEFTKVVTHGVYHREELPDGQIKRHRVGENVVSWLFGYDEDKKRIYIDRNNEGKKFFKVVEGVWGYVYKVQRTQIQCTDITGLYNHFKDWLCDDFMVYACENVLEAIYNNVKPIKA